MARPIWTGQVSFGLVNVPVKLFTAVRSHDVRFHQLHETTRARVRRRRVDEQTGEEVPRDEIVKGYETEDGRYVVVDPDELAALDPEASRTIELEDFVELADIEPLYYDRPYYLGPDGDAARKPYHLLVTAMERTGRAGIARFVMRSREHLAALRPLDGTLVLNTLNYADEVVDPGELEGVRAEDIELSDRELDMAEQLIGSLESDFDPTGYRDEYHDAVVELLERKAEGEDVEVPAATEEPSADVIDLMDALERSLQGASAAVDEPSELSELTKSELYELAQERDVPGRSDMTKDELVAALSEGGTAAAS